MDEIDHGRYGCIKKNIAANNGPNKWCKTLHQDLKLKEEQQDETRTDISN
ncbi:MAG TPA: hypothetical protein VE619_01865 [Nitrososphaeraceae archaeon]|nr:hypothetical protein [Nitrososphaeraceae archaeon]